MKILTPAKINIGLRIVRKRSDSYHDIETVFYPIHLADELEIVKGEKLEFFSNINLERDANLCLRALHFFCERTGIYAEVKITLRKNIPIGAGLGGGSSDAAAVLLALQELYGHPLSEIEIFDIASTLGADVPFFLKRVPSYATGKGEILEPFHYRVDGSILTVTPEAAVPTPLAYSMATPSGEPQEHLRSILEKLGSGFSEYRERVVNDFEPQVFRKFPVIGEIKAAMYSAGAEFALMSGSGSSVFGFFKTDEVAKSALAKLKERFSLRAADITPKGD